MYWILLFSFLYIVKKYVTNDLRVGLDERIIFNPENITSEKIFQIYEISEKIHFLESENIVVEDKIYEIKNRNVPETIIMIHGGLLNDWNFDFE
jgi:hypothetical protein